MRSVGRLVAAVVTTMVLTAGVATGASAAATPCVPGAMPYEGLPGATLTAETHASLDADPVHYVRWRGFVPSFDGLPLSVDVTVPCDGDGGALPTMLMAHGFTDDKTIWQETGKSDTVDSIDRPASNTRWNNIWFASRGYTTVNYTARGWNDSCGPSTPGATPLAPAPSCAAFDYWIHLDDKRWEVRDAQWLLAGLVESGHADPDRLAMSGGSYGGAPTLVVALQGDRIMCGASPVPAELGDDPCAGVEDGSFAPWTTRDGATRLELAAAVPTITFADIVQVLAPNGRSSDGWEHAPAPGDVTSPVGVPIQSSLAGLLATGNAFGHFAPPGVDPTSDIIADATRVLAGNPFPPEDPVIARALSVYRRFKSPITSEPLGDVPIFWVHGHTDPLFTAFEPLGMQQALERQRPGYPFKLLLGDFGHDYAAQRVDEGQYAIDLMNAFVDHYLRPDRTPDAPAFDATASISRCLDPDAPMDYRTAPTWHDLHPDVAVFEASTGGATSTAVAGENARATDPISTASLPAPGAYRGCRIVSPARLDPTTVTFDFPLTQELVLLGGPVVETDVTVSAPDVPLSARLWDVAPDGTSQGLVTRFTHRIADGPGTSAVAFQLAPAGYRFPAGHTLRLELTANDSPYYQASNIEAVAQVDGVVLRMPVAAATGSSGTTSDGVTAGGSAGAGLAATGGGLSLLAAGVGAVAFGLRRRRPLR